MNYLHINVNIFYYKIYSLYTNQRNSEEICKNIQINSQYVSFYVNISILMLYILYLYSHVMQARFQAAKYIRIYMKCAKNTCLFKVWVVKTRQFTSSVTKKILFSSLQILHICKYMYFYLYIIINNTQNYILKQKHAKLWKSEHRKHLRLCSKTFPFPCAYMHSRIRCIQSKHFMCQLNLIYLLMLFFILSAFNYVKCSLCILKFVVRGV